MQGPGFVHQLHDMVDHLADEHTRGDLLGLSPLYCQESRILQQHVAASDLVAAKKVCGRACG